MEIFLGCCLLILLFGGVGRLGGFLGGLVALAIFLGMIGIIIFCVVALFAGTLTLVPAVFGLASLFILFLVVRNTLL